MNFLNGVPDYKSIQAEANHLSLDFIGITTPEPSEDFSFFQNWLSHGYHGKMDYLAREMELKIRQNPRMFFPEVRSILIAGIQYPLIPVEATPSSHWHGRIASYATSVDYHVFLNRRLKQLAEWILTTAGKAGHAFRCAADSEPILERSLAYRAGLGWIGKNSCLIHPQFGSATLLGAIFLPIEIEPQSPFLSDRCGTCTRCIQACPTGCILPDRTVDSRRCISYLTIEHKTSIPIDLRPKLQNWVFGCDICLQACPWNKKVPEAVHWNSSISNHPDLLSELLLDPIQFNQKYKTTPLLYARRNRYLRNVCIALANLKCSDAFSTLAQLASTDPNPLVRASAVWAAGKIDQQRSYSILSKCQTSETDPNVLEEIRYILNVSTAASEGK